MDPIVVDPPDFDQDEAWGECKGWVDKHGGLGEENPRSMMAAAGADPGVCSCPACHEHYWAWGRKQKCVKCGFVYPTDAWCMYAWGVHAAWRTPSKRLHEERISHPYYRYGYENPVENPIDEFKRIDWRTEMEGVE